MAIEVDGSIHRKEDREKIDKGRQKIIEANGIKVLRFTNSDVLKNIFGVLEKINRTLEKGQKHKSRFPRFTGETLERSESKGRNKEINAPTIF